MNTRTDELMEEALALAPEDRLVLMLALLDSLQSEDDPSPVSQAWAKELHERVERLRNGTDQPINWDKLRAEINSW